MKITDMTNIASVYNKEENFRILVCAEDNDSALLFATEYGAEAGLKGTWEIEDEWDEDTVFDCDYIISESNRSLDVESHNMLALSTAHLTYEVVRDLDCGQVEGLVYYGKGDYGFFVYTGEMRPGEIEIYYPELLKCLNFALDKGFNWIMFDMDVDPISELPVYDWEDC